MKKKVFRIILAVLAVLVIVVILYVSSHRREGTKSSNEKAENDLNNFKNFNWMGTGNTRGANDFNNFKIGRWGGKPKEKSADAPEQGRTQQEQKTDCNKWSGKTCKDANGLFTKSQFQKNKDCAELRQCGHKCIWSGDVTGGCISGGL